ncbi:uncharacterized protein BDR25DRAFT_30592 [Lindgomyces ingoldianus]|uniref:Uncharacterized protein n=1 Tax=Lindgomyces ingoldianus TaxID=673940 RepID=A0ACB6QVN8_9PLEO|nr:uncharacterized protein BDR25DRAFT_30592 [Lindgomyces ingoldianus]KAF2471109.1 hypothetical protein BDR25DRAFT_30592 [Lindgomyces ingoldianus]
MTACGPAIFNQTADGGFRILQHKMHLSTFAFNARRLRNREPLEKVLACSSPDLAAPASQAPRSRISPHFAPSSTSHPHEFKSSMAAHLPGTVRLRMTGHLPSASEGARHSPFGRLQDTSDSRLELDVVQ